MHAANLLSKRAHLTPDREALVDLETGRCYTYAELNERANRLANFMQTRLDIQKGDRVSILAQNSVIYLDLLYGLAKIGAIFAPLNWRLTANELEYIVNDLQPKVLIVAAEFMPLFDELQKRVQVPYYVGVENAALRGAPSYEVETAAASPAEPATPELSGEDTCCILYTSGTTGYPKGAMLPHRQILWNCINTIVSWGLREDDISPIFTPLFHAGGLFAFLTPLLYVGGKIVLTRKFDTDESLRTIVNEKCTVILGVPTLYQLWEKSPVFPDADFSHVRFFINGGAHCPREIMEHWRAAKGIVFRQGYGLTEVGTNCFSMTDEESVPKTGSVGKPIFHSEMRLVDPETHKEVPQGEAGELLIKGPHVTTGYWGKPEATAQALVDGWFYTGDMAKMDEDGFYTIVGRYKDMIKTGGENVYAAEVEAVFRDHPAVAECALIGAPDPKWGEVGVMVVVLRPGCQATKAELLEACQGRIAKFKIPKQVILTDALPYSPYGKVQKVELKKHFIES